MEHAPQSPGFDRRPKTIVENQVGTRSWRKSDLWGNSEVIQQPGDGSFHVSPGVFKPFTKPSKDVEAVRRVVGTIRRSTHNDPGRSGLEDTEVPPPPPLRGSSGNRKSLGHRGPKSLTRVGQQGGLTWDPFFSLITF